MVTVQVEEKVLNHDMYRHVDDNSSVHPSAYEYCAIYVHLRGTTFQSIIYDFFRSESCMEFTDPFDWPATMPELRVSFLVLRYLYCSLR